LKLGRYPHFLAATVAALPWSLALPRARASYPSCFAVYPRDSRSRRVLCHSSHSLHSNRVKNDVSQELPCSCTKRPLQ